MGATRSELLKLAQDLAKLEDQARREGPQNDDELHAFIKERWGLHIARVAVDPGHAAPFDVVADVFFDRETAVLVIGGRETGKTMDVAVIHALKARFRPGYEGISAGAIEEQSKKAYSSLRTLNAKWGSDSIKDSLQSETNWKNGSKVEIKLGTMAALNGPHSNLLHRDEGELFRDDAFDEADNITKSGVDKNGKRIPAQDIITSSRKFAKGRLQKLLDDNEEARKQGREEPYKVYVIGVAETVQRQDNCRHDPKNSGSSEEELCPCARYAKGKWDDGSERTLDSVCNGRFAKSDGHRPLSDIIKKFSTNSRGMWEAQHECKKPAGEGLILPEFSPERHGIRNYKPDPENGRIFQGIDAGGTHAHATNWYQLIERATEAINYHGETIVIRPGTIVAFDEVYISEVGNNPFAKRIHAHEADWRNEFGEFWEVEERYMDIAAKAARLDFRDDHDLPTTWRITREVESHIQIIQGRVNEDSFLIDVDRCPMIVEEAQAWQRDPSTGKPIETFDHCLAACRYALANIERKLVIERKARGTYTSDSPQTQQGKDTKDAQERYDLTREPDTGPAVASWHEDEPMTMPIHGGGTGERDPMAAPDTLPW